MKRLFKRDNDVETLRAIREAKVPDVRTLVEGFPDELWRIIARALEQDPDKRYPSSEALGAELDAFVGARRPAMKGELAALLTRLFPGQEARQARWERAATSVHLPMATMPPPAPVPTASSSMLEVEADAEPDQVVPKVEVVAAQADVEAEAASEREAIRVETSAERPAPPPAEASARTGKKKKKKRHGNGPKKGRSKPVASTTAEGPPPATSSRRRRRPLAEPQPIAVEEPPRRGWLSVAVAIAVVIALALLFAAR
jgi:serine/threonine-protein kinase